MESPQALLAAPLVESIGWALVHSTWQIALVAALFAVAQFALRRHSAALRYALGCTALGTMAMVVAATVCLVWTTLGDRSRPASIAAAPRSVVVEPAIDPIVVPTTIHDGSEIPSIPTPAPAVEMPSETSPAIEASSSGSPPSAPFRRRLIDTIGEWLPWLVAGWLLGVVGFASRLACGWLGVRRLRRRGITPVAGALEERLVRLSNRLGLDRAATLVMSTIVEVPAVIGHFRPAILLPVSLATGLSPLQIDVMLLHELAHIRRHDYLVNLIQTVIETVLFHHPAMWWVSRQVRQERENCCDDLALAVCGDRAAYAGALAAMEELRTAVYQPAVAASGGNLLTRVRRIVGRPAEGPGRRHAWLAGMLLLGIILATTIGVMGATSGNIGAEVNDQQNQSSVEQLADWSPPAAESSAEKAAIEPPRFALYRVLGHENVLPRSEKDVMRGRTIFYKEKNGHDNFICMHPEKYPLGGLILDDKPLLTDGDVVSFSPPGDFRINPDAAKRMRKIWPHINPEIYGVPFVVVVGGERIYLGAFFTALSSVPPAVPTITVDLMRDNEFTIEQNRWDREGHRLDGSPENDPCMDPRILHVFRQQHKLLDDTTSKPPAANEPTANAADSSTTNNQSQKRPSIDPKEDHEGYRIEKMKQDFEEAMPPSRDGLSAKQCEEAIRLWGLSEHRIRELMDDWRWPRATPRMNRAMAPIVARMLQARDEGGWNDTEMRAEFFDLYLRKATAGQPVEGLAVSVRPLEETYVKGKPIEVEWKIKNVGDVSRKILWHERHYSPVLFGFMRPETREVFGTDIRRHFTNRLPGPPEVIELAPGEAKTARFDFSRFVPYADVSPGTYQVVGYYWPRSTELNLPKKFLAKAAQEGAMLDRVVSAPIQIRIEAPATYATPPKKVKRDKPATLVIEYDMFGDEPMGIFRLQRKTRDGAGWRVHEEHEPIVVQNGGFTKVDDLRPGIYDLARLKATKHLDRRMNLGGKTFLCDRRDVELAPGETTTVRFRREDDARPITGRVTGLPDDSPYTLTVAVRTAGATGDPRSDEEARLRTYDALSCWPDKPFTTAPIPPGRYTLVAVAYRPLKNPSQHGLVLPDFLGTADVTVPAEGNVPEVEIKMMPREEFEKRLKTVTTTSETTAGSSKGEPEPPTTPSAVLPDGVSVELIGVARNPSSEHSWWRPDGAPLTVAPYAYKHAVFPERTGFVAYEMAFRLTGLPPGTPHSSVRFSVDGSDASGNLVAQDAAGKELQNIRAMIVWMPKDQKTTNVDVRVGDGPWHDVFVFAANSVGNGVKLGESVDVDRPVARGDDVVVHWEASLPWLDSRDVDVVIEDAKGNLLHAVGRKSLRAGRYYCTSTFRNKSLDDLVDVHLRERNLNVVRFENVPLRPGAKPAVRTVVRDGANPLGLDDATLIKLFKAGQILHYAAFDRERYFREHDRQHPERQGRDPFAPDKPLRLVLKQGRPDLVQVWSVGPDGDWDGGKPIDSQTGTLDGDIGFEMSRDRRKTRWLADGPIERCLEGTRLAHYLAAKGPKQPKPTFKDDGLTWGPVVDGLQLAAELTPAGPYTLGQPIKIRFHVRNAAEYPIQIGINVPTRQDMGQDAVIIQDAAGRRLQGHSILYSGMISTQHRTIEPGQSTTYASSGLALVASGTKFNGRDMVGYWVEAEPGRYSVRFRQRFPITSGLEPKDWQGILETGRIDIQVIEESKPAGENALIIKPAETDLENVIETSVPDVSPVS